MIIKVINLNIKLQKNITNTCLNLVVSYACDLQGIQNTIRNLQSKKSWFF